MDRLTARQWLHSYPRAVVSLLVFGTLWLIVRNSSNLLPAPPILLGDLQVRPSSPPTYIRLGDLTPEGMGNGLRHIGADMWTAECLGAKFVIEFGDLNDNGPRVTDILSSTRVADVSNICWLKYGNREFLEMVEDRKGDCVSIREDVEKKSGGMLPHCTTIVRVSNGVESGDYSSIWEMTTNDKAAITSLAVKRLCGEMELQNRAMFYLRWGDVAGKNISENRWTTPTLAHMQTMFKEAVALSGTKDIDLYMEGAQSSFADEIAGTDIPGASLTLKSTLNMVDDLCAMAKYKYMVASSSTLAKVALSYRMAEKKYKMYRIWLDTDDKPLETQSPFEDGW